MIFSFKVTTDREAFTEENCQLEIDFFASDDERQVSFQDKQIHIPDINFD